MTKSSSYSRDLTKKEIKDIQAKYAPHMKRTRKGFLERPVKERLLHITNWKEETTNEEIYRYFYEIREHAKSAIDDFRLLCDILTESQLQEIFAREEIHEVKQFQLKIRETVYPISLLLKSILPNPIYVGEDAQKEMEKIRNQNEWRKNIIENVLVESLVWYFYSGLFKTDKEKQLIFDMIDQVTVASSGIKKYELKKELDKMDIVRFR